MNETRQSLSDLAPFPLPQRAMLAKVIKDNVQLLRQARLRIKWQRAHYIKLTVQFRFEKTFERNIFHCNLYSINGVLLHRSISLVIGPKRRERIIAVLRNCFIVAFIYAKESLR